MATYAQQPQDENLIPGWNVQGNGYSNSTWGVPGAGYATPAAVPATAAYTGSGLQPGSGYPNPPKAEDIGSENDGASTSPILTNTGYAGAGLNLTATQTTPVPTSNGVQNPYGVQAQITIDASAGTTAQVAPYAATYSAATFGGAITVPTGYSTLSIPPAGWIKVATPGDVTSVVWVPTN